MGAGVFHVRVRDGNGCGNSAMATRPPDQMHMVMRVGSGGVRCARCAIWRCARWCPCGHRAVKCVMEFYRVIRTARLNRLPGFYLRPINVVVYHGP